jgi:hypothetical protein
MKLPNAHLATVPERKMTHYLLNPAHPAGGTKAAFFLRFGFTVANWRDFADALVRHARANEVIASERTRHGMRYVVDGVLHAPDGTALNVRSAWYIHRGSDRPRFVTAHPLRKL